MCPQYPVQPEVTGCERLVNFNSLDITGFYGILPDIDYSLNVIENLPM